MPKKTTPAVKRQPKAKAALVPVAEAHANNMVIPVAETFKLSEVSKAMRQKIKQRADEENNITEAIKRRV